MHRFRILACAAAITAFGLQIVRADTVLDILGVEKSIDDVSRRAQETGDHVAESFAKAALKAITEWKKANADLIDKGFDRLDASSQDMFRELNDTAVRLQKGEQVTFIDFQRGIAASGTALARAPGSSREPQVAFSWPSVILPLGEPVVTVHVIGSRIADAHASMSYDGKAIPYSAISDNEITADLARDSLPSDKANRSKGSISLDYKVSTSSWYNPLTWWSTELRHRDIEFSVLPEIPGDVAVDLSIRTDGWETKVLGPLTLSGRGRENTDPYPYSTTPLDREEGWIIDKVAQKVAQWDDDGGHGEGGSKCLRYDENSFTDVGFNFLVWHGNTDNWTGHHDAAQYCRVWVHLKRSTHADSTDSRRADLQWQHDTGITIPANATKYVVHYHLFTGVSYEIANKEQIPYDLFQIFRDKDEVKFRPRPQRDF